MQIRLFAGLRLVNPVAPFASSALHTDTLSNVRALRFLRSQFQSNDYDRSHLYDQ
jgi:hypothetical protein